jgi:cyclin-dependent kinase regulatory subunit CKS1
MSKKQDDDFDYTDDYADDTFEYRQVIINKGEIQARLPYPHRILMENEWRNLGVCQSAGWENYAIYKAERHVLLFRRLKNQIH